MIRLSIIVPFYNVEKYIEQCIRSLYDQDIPQEEYEVICVDDCSLDGSRAIVERLQKEYPNLQLIIHERNKKLGGARNTGLRAAQGEYVLFVDSDDYLKTNVLHRLLYEVDGNALDLVGFDVAIFEQGEQHEVDDRICINTPVLKGVDLFFYPGFTWTCQHITAWRKIYRKTFLMENNLFFAEDMMFEDNEFCFRVYNCAQRTRYIDAAPYVYRINDASITHSQVSFRQVDSLAKLLPRMFALYNEFLKNRADDRFINELRRFISWNMSKLCETTPLLSKNEQSLVVKQLHNQSVMPYLKVCGKKLFGKYLFLLYHK